MKRTTTVNIGGQVFNMDEDAHEMLDYYLASIAGQFQDEKERKDIMDDVEARIAEIFRNKITPFRQVITAGDVNDMMLIMGKPSDFGTEDEELPGYSRKRGYRRMYRDPDARILGGVCGGMGAYWHIDPIILRILFLISFFGFGIGLIVYILLWIVIPVAKTTAQKLEMRGEPVTVENIKRFVREEFRNVKKSIRL
jgi:phage shock protein PspC (stress-responsive transcriptional regulator)